jgi:hypothetical protein
MPRRSLIFMAVAMSPFALFLFGTACSDPPTRPGPAGDGTAKPIQAGGGKTDGSVEGGEGGAVGVDSGVSPFDASPCNAVVLTGQIVDRIGVNSEPPVATGGVIADGTYDLTAYSVYVGVGGVGGPTGITARMTLETSSPKLDEIIELGGVGKTPTTTRRKSTYSVSGATFSTLESCPTGAVLSRQFTVTGTTTLVLTDLLTKEEFTFTKR